MKKYIVKPGDSLGKIAQHFYGDPQKYKLIAKANSIVNPDVIYVGQRLVIPGVNNKKVREAHKPQTAAPVLGESIYSMEILKRIMPTARSNDLLYYIDALNENALHSSINTALRAAHFIAQIAHESGCLRYKSENLNYGSKGLHLVFRKYFPDEKLADEYAHQPERIANKVYANRMNNGDEKSGDGWRYRGRGLIQLTGKSNYEKCSKEIGIDLVANPDLILNSADIAVKTATWFWTRNRLNKWADKDDVRQLTRRINGGYHGINERINFLIKAKEAYNI